MEGSAAPQLIFVTESHEHWAAADTQITAFLLFLSSCCLLPGELVMVNREIWMEEWEN